MKRVPIAELKARLSEHLEAVKAGSEAVILDSRLREAARLEGMAVLP